MYWQEEQKIRCRHVQNWLMWSTSRYCARVKTSNFLPIAAKTLISAALAIWLQSRHSPFWRRQSKWKFHQRPFVSTTCNWNIQQTWKGFEEGLSRAHSPVMAPVVRDLERRSLVGNISRHKLFSPLLPLNDLWVGLNISYCHFPGSLPDFPAPRLITVEGNLTRVTTRSTLCCWENSTHRLQRLRGLRNREEQVLFFALSCSAWHTCSFADTMHTNLCNL